MSRMLLGTIGIVSAALFPMLAMADDAKPNGIITAVSSSATISARGLPPDSEMWAMWVSLPPGKTVNHPGSDKGLWIDFQLGLNGSVVTLDSSPDDPAKGPCYFFKAGGKQDIWLPELEVGAGDGFACSATLSSSYREENRGSETYMRAQLDIGGPWQTGMGDTPQEFRNGGGGVSVSGLSSSEFGAVQAETMKAGAMTLTIRQVTVPSGVRQILVDPSPVLRMVSEGELKWAVLTPDADLNAIPKVMFNKKSLDWLAKDSQSDGAPAVVANDSGQPATYIEWSVTVAQVPPQ